jgi:carboxylesterase
VTTFIRNPHLEGSSFLWEGGPVGVLLVHGYTATTAEVRLIGRFLHERGYTVAGPLLPGHGTTPREMNRCRWEDWAAAAEDAYQTLATRCDSVFVGGESMGGVLALYLASQHPEIAGVLSYAAAIKLPQSSTRMLLLPLLALFIPYVEKHLGRFSAADPRWQGYDVNPLQATRQMLKLQSAVRARLYAIAQPLLIVQGRLDASVAADAPDFIYQSVASTRKRLHWFEHSTHCVLLDREWKDVAALTVQFMEEVLADNE